MEAGDQFPVTGQHDNAPDGIFMITGPGVKAGLSLEKFDYLDLTPTLLSILGVPVADDMDGLDRSAEFIEPWARFPARGSVASYGARREYPTRGIQRLDVEIHQKLKALGYVK